MKTPLLVALAFSACSPAVLSALPKPDRGGVPPSKLYDYGEMGPPATPAIVAAAQAAITTPLPAGPFEPTWESLEKNYRVPSWFHPAKFGIFMHWGLYAVPAHRNEWYEKHLYGADLTWHTEHFGPPENFGYKDFIPLFKQEKFDADAWAALFKKSGARLVMPTAQHHDNYALWDSKVTPFNAKKTGPHRDLIGELATAVRKQGMKFGLSNHGVENFTFINPSAELTERLKAAKADLYDPEWATFYNVADRSPAAMSRFLADWQNRNFEIIDNYQPDLLWFDNGANLRVLDPLKLQVAAYYYNRAQQWGKEVSLSTKFVCYAPSNDDSKQIGSILDFEKVGTRSPAEIRPAPWMVDDTLGSTWGYTDGMKTTSAETIIKHLVDTVSKDGFYLLNLAPKADGTIPEEQQKVLLEIGEWLSKNGEAIYDTYAWTTFGEGDWRYTVKGGAIYAIGTLPKRDSNATHATGIHLALITPEVGKVVQVELIESASARSSLKFTQNQSGLHIPADVSARALTAPGLPIVLKISGLKL